MPTVAETYQYVVGVDTHAATHQYAIVHAPDGRLVDEAGFPNSGAGLARAVAWIARRTESAPSQVLISAEGTGSYGARLARLGLQAGYRVVDAPAPRRDRGQDKNDTIDAIKAARGPLHKQADRLADVRAGDAQGCAQILSTARDQMSRERTRAVNALNARIRGHDLGIDARRKLTRTQIRAIARWQSRQESPLLQAARADAVRHARRILELDHDLKDNTRQLRALTLQHLPALLDLPGIGPVNAGIILAVWSHPGRIHSEAAFAKLGGVSPIETSSGNSAERSPEHRLNPGGERQLNRALHNIATTRMRADERTQGYVQRRTTEGLSRRRIRRCLKRYIARDIHRTLTRAAA